MRPRSAVGAGLWIALALASFASAGGCSGESTSGASERAASSSGAAPVPEAPSDREREVEQLYEAPVATRRFVWTTNPASGRVAYVDAATLEVRTALAGNRPSVIASVPGLQDAAIVLNTLSRDATLLVSEGNNLRSQTFALGVDANSWALAESGRWAIAWADARKVANAPRTRGFQDLAVLDMTGAVRTAVLSVGYRPSLVRFTSRGERALVVTQDGLSVIDLLASGGPALRSQVALADSPARAAAIRDVSITPDGTFAVVRYEGASDVGVIDLATGARVDVVLPGPVTDLDLSRDGARAVAVMRSVPAVALLPLPGIFGQPSTFSRIDLPGESAGSVSLASGADVGLLYSNALGAPERVAVLNLAAPPSFRGVRVYAPVLAAFPSADGAFGVLVHDAVAGVPGAFSLLPMAASLPAKIVETAGPVHSLAMSPASDRAVLAERGTTRESYGAYLIKFPSLATQRFALASPPNAVGIVPDAKRAFVAQDYPDGRITFIDTETGAARTLTGFELGARVVTGSEGVAK